MRAVSIFSAVVLQALVVSQYAADARGLQVAQDRAPEGSASFMAANPQLRSNQDAMQARANDFVKVAFESDPEPAAAPNDTSASPASPAEASESVAPASTNDASSAPASTPSGDAGTASTPGGDAGTASTPGGDAGTASGAGNVDDSVYAVVGGVLPEAGAAVSLLADTEAAASNALPWTFKLGAASSSQSLVGRELVGLSSLASSVCNNGAIKILVAVSTCFSSTGFNRIKAWASALEAVDGQVFPPTNNVVLTYKFTKDGCDVPNFWNSNRDDVSKNSGGNYDVLVSVVVLGPGSTPVQTYINSANNKPALAGYVYSQPGWTNSPTIAGYDVAMWRESSQVFLTRDDAVKTLSKAHCAAIAGSTPQISTVNGKRQCACACPSGYERSGNSCRKKATPAADECACAWKESTGYSFSVTTAGSTCVIDKLATNNVLPAPVASDNYVGYLRDNLGDSSPSATSPRIELSVAKEVTSFSTGPTSLQESAYSPNPLRFSWKTFRETSPIDTVSLPKVGRYKLEMKAVDYTSEDKCTACVVVIDNFRPTPTTTCPAALPSTTTLGLADISTATSAMCAVKTYKSQASNDGCGANVRCDAETLQVKRFAADTADPVTNCISAADDAFDAQNVKTDLWAQLQKMPLNSANNEQTWTKSVCTRCATASVTLKEWYAPYTCSALSVTPECVGTAPACSVSRCVEAKGSTIASATASLLDSVQTASLNVLKGKVEHKTLSDNEIKAKFPQLDKSVHIALPECTTSTGGTPTDKCKTSAKVFDLLAFSSTSLWPSKLSNTEVQSIVSWRYKVGSSTTWKALSAQTAAETFSMDSTSITVEAWTTCGKVKDFTFYVYLHINTEIKVCESFRRMWYEGPFVPVVPADEFCMYENSDFTVATFDFDATTGLPQSSGFIAAVSGVKCSISYGDATDGVEVLSYPLSGSTATGFDITEEIAIGGATKDTTLPMTTVTVTCDFTYKHTVNDGSTPVSKSCDRVIKIKDCTPPKISKPCPYQNECTYDKCAKNGIASPDINQACGGKRVSQGANKKAQFASTATSTCCASCTTSGYSTSCSALEGINTKRCEVVKVTTPQALEAAVDDLASSVMNSAHAAGALDVTSALLGASAMVAVVALVVVRRRRAAAERATVEEDAYYPLMG